MTTTELRQRLAAILAADVAGYSRLMAQDDRATVTALDAARAVFATHISSHGGRVNDMTGDSILAVFDSASGAVRTALAIQSDLAGMAGDTPPDRRMQFRIGVHLGDVIEKPDGTVYGDGVNIAARLESLAEPGGIAISAAVNDAVRRRVAATFVDRGEHSVKNIPQPVHAFGWSQAGAAPFAAAAPAVRKASAVNHSIAVLSFDNLGNDPEQEYFADGMAEDLLTLLSRHRWLTVIARNSSFTYKGQPKDARRVGRELGARYVLEGSVRKLGSRVRVACELIDAETGKQVWAERYDRQLHDVFELQDEMTLTIAGSIAPELSKAEQHRARIGSVDQLGAWDLYHRGLWRLWQYGREANQEAQQLFRAAIDADAEFGPAHAHLALAIFSGVFNGLGDPPESLALARDAALRALGIDSRDAVAHFVLGRIATQVGQHATAIAELETAIRLNPSLAQAHYGLGNALCVANQPGQAIARLQTATRLSPHDPSMWAFEAVQAFALVLLGRLEEAEAMGRAATAHPNSTFWAFVNLACALGHAGKTDEARGALDRVLELCPGFSQAYVMRIFAGGIPEVVACYLEGLRKAGMRLA